jgi:hypothetical protein
MTIYTTLIFVVAWVYLLWVLYLAVQSLITNRSKLSPWVVWLGYIPFAIALVLDVALNWLVLTVLFYEFPREWTVSDRLSRHKRKGSGWRQRFSDWVGRMMLDPFDPSGTHI